MRWDTEAIGAFLTCRRTDPVSTHVKNKGAEFLTAEEEVTNMKGDKLKVNSGFVAEMKTPVFKCMDFSIYNYT